MKKAQTPFQVMIKPRGPICNLACEYCYYLPKTQLFPNSNFHMSQELLAEATRQIIAATPGHQVDFTWQGGEPTLMGLDFFKEAIHLQQSLAPPGTRISNSLQTNGTQINPAWCRFFKENNFLIGLSLDGPPAQHNIYRHDKAGNSRYEDVLRAARLLKRHEVEFNILCCVHQGNVKSPIEVYRYLRDKVGAQFIQFIPILQRVVNQKGAETMEITPISVDGKSYGEFLIAIFDEWVCNDVGKVFVQIFDVALGVWAGRPAGLCVFAETCGRALVLEHNGDLFSCDHFVTANHRLGNITDTPLVELVDSARQWKFGENKRTSLPQTCLECDVRFICNGGCPKNRDEKGLNRLCVGYKAFFHHIDKPMRQMVHLLQHRRPPADIMQSYSTQEED